MLESYFIYHRNISTLKYRIQKFKSESTFFSRFDGVKIVRCLDVNSFAMKMKLTSQVLSILDMTSSLATDIIKTLQKLFVY